MINEYSQCASVILWVWLVMVQRLIYLVRLSLAIHKYCDTNDIIDKNII